MQGKLTVLWTQRRISVACMFLSRVHVLVPRTRARSPHTHYFFMIVSSFALRAHPTRRTRPSVAPLLRRRARNAALYARRHVFLRSHPQTLISLEIPYINTLFCMSKTVRFDVQNVGGTTRFWGPKVVFWTTQKEEKSGKKS